MFTMSTLNEKEIVLYFKTSKFGSFRQLVISKKAHSFHKAVLMAAYLGGNENKEREREREQVFKINFSQLKSQNTKKTF